MSTAPKPNPTVRSLACPNCGGIVEIRGMGRTLTVVCVQCLTILDATTPSLQVIQQFQSKERYRPLIPLGTRGKMRGDPYEAIGFQVREMTADGLPYTWAEYVLFNPFKGFRYLTEYNGHWNDTAALQSVPTSGRSIRGRPTMGLLGETYQHFQNYCAKTIYVMGEFPWQVRVGESAECDDYISPPRMLSSEKLENEVTWSLGEYTPGAAIWKNFGLQGSPPAPMGIFANQPSPHTGAIGKAWARFAFWLLVLLAVQLFFAVFHSNKTVFSQKYSFTHQSRAQTENSFVTEVFDVQGRTSNVEVDLSTDLDNNWAYFNLALINADSGQAYDFSRQVSYYHGRDSDGNWSEGRARASVVLSAIAPGRYYVRVEPEMEAQGTALNAVRYQVRVTRDVTTWAFFLIGALVLLIPPVFVTIRTGAFEGRRWAESDYGGSSSKGDDE
ncbi:MAG: DUF4178 domain-containing protein [Acidobacteria bacterium]|nr:DUF4178 domain-containing protein [Acidobacteriota bacterium]